MTRWPSLRVNIAALRVRDRTALDHKSSDRSEIPIAETVTAGQMEITTARIAEGTPIEVDGKVRPSISGVEFSGTVTSSWVGECRRCVEPVMGAIDAEVRATFLEDHEIVAEDTNDAYPIEGDWIDVGEVVYEELMLALPLTPLCSPDCPGADPEHFPNVVPGEISADVAQLDPRWAVLSEMTFDED